MASIFLSYARRDASAVAHVHDALTSYGHRLWIDVSDLPAASPWREDVARAIERSDVFLFAVSRDSLRSIECRREFEHARDLRKRIVPVVLDDTQPASAPPDLADIGWISAADRALIDRAIRIDPEHLERHTRFLLPALEWKRNRGGVLRGKALKEAQLWLASAEARNAEPPPAPEHHEFIAASLRAQRTRRIAAAVTAVVVLAVVVFLSTFARERARAAKANALAEESEQLWKRRQLDEAMLRAVEAYRLAPTSSAFRALANAVQTEPQLELLLHGRAHETGSMAFSPSGDRLAVGGADGSIQIWDARTWKPLDPIVTGSDRVDALAYTPDGKVLVSGDWAARIRRWDTTTGKEIGAPLHLPRGMVAALAMHPDGRFLAASYAAGAALWDLGQSPPSATDLVDRSRPSSAVAFSNDGRALAAVEGTETLFVWSFDGGTLGDPRARKFGESGVTALAIHDGTIAAGLADGSVLRLDGGDLSERERSASHNRAVLALAFDANGEALASAGGDHRVAVARNGERRAFEIRGRVFAVALDARSTRLAAGGADRAVYVLDLRLRQPLAQVIRRERNGIQQLSFDARGNVIASPEYPQFPASLQGVPVAEPMDATVSADGELLAVGDDAGTIGLWNARSRQFIRSWKTAEAAADVAFSPDGKRLASVNSANGDISLIDVDGTEVTAFKGECPRVFSVAFLGGHLVTGCDDGSLEIVDPVERKSIVRMADHEEAIADFVNVLAVRGNRVAAGTADGRVLLWNLDPQWWMRRACRRANRDAAPCRPFSGLPAEIPSDTPPPDNKAIPDDRDPPSIVARSTLAAPHPAPRRR